MTSTPSHFCPAGNGLFVLYYGWIGNIPGSEPQAIRDARPNFVIVADAYYNNQSVPRFFHFDDDGAPTSIRVLAYVATGHAAGPSLDRVLGKVRIAMSGGYNGIFFDEVANNSEADTVDFYSTLTKEVRSFGDDNLIIFNPGVNEVQGWHFDRADIVSVENNPNPMINNEPDFNLSPRTFDRRVIEPWRWLAVQGGPAKFAAATLEQAVHRLESLRSSGIFWYYSGPFQAEGSTHFILADFFDDFVTHVKGQAGPLC